MNKPIEKDFDFLDDILEEISTVEMKKIEQKMLNSEKIRKAMDAKGWNKTRLLEEMNMKSASIITKWLSGTHNFTQDTLIEIGQVLDIDFFKQTKESAPVNVFTVYLENKTEGFDTPNSIRYILDKNTIKLGNGSNSTTIYHA